MKKSAWGRKSYLRKKPMYIQMMMEKRRYRLYHIRSIYGVFFYLFRKIRLKKEFLV